MWTRTTDVNCCQMCVLKSIFLKSLYKTAYFAHSGHCLTQGSNASQWLWINNSECWHSWMEPLLFMAATGTNSRWLSHIWNQAVLSTVLAPIVTVSQGSLFLELCFVYCIFLFFFFLCPSVCWLRWAVSVTTSFFHSSSLGSLNWNSYTILAQNVFYKNKHWAN